MLIEKYDVRLKRLTPDKIELVRTWRNDPKISRYMEFREYITPEMQQTWFERINNNNNYYFIIEFEGKEVGLVNIRDIDYKKKEGEGGIFIYDDSYLNSTLSFQVALCLNDFGFEVVGLEQIIAHIMCDNKRAINYNKLQGYKIVSGQECVKNQLYTLTKDDYIKSRERIARLIS